MGHVAYRAARELGVEEALKSSPPAFAQNRTYAAFQRANEWFVPIKSLLTHVTIMGPDRAAMASPWRDVTMEQLVDADQELLLPGSPFRQYLILPNSFGDFVGLEWPELAAHFERLWQIVSALPENEEFWETLGKAADITGVAATSGWIAAAVRKLKRRYASRRESIHSTADQLARAGISPTELHRLMMARPWRSEELGRLLQCSAELAEAIAWSQGFAKSRKTGYWKTAGHNPEDEILHAELHEALGNVDNVEFALKRIAIYLRSKELPSDPKEVEESVVWFPRPEITPGPAAEPYQIMDSSTDLRPLVPVPSYESYTPERPSAWRELPPDPQFLYSSCGALSPGTIARMVGLVLSYMRAQVTDDPLPAIRFELWEWAGSTAQYLWDDSADGYLDVSHVRANLTPALAGPSSLSDDALDAVESEGELRMLLYLDVRSALDGKIERIGPDKWKAAVRRDYISRIGNLQEEVESRARQITCPDPLERLSMAVEYLQRSVRSVRHQNSRYALRIGGPGSST